MVSPRLRGVDDMSLVDDGRRGGILCGVTDGMFGDLRGRYHDSKASDFGAFGMATVEG